MKSLPIIAFFMCCAFAAEQPLPGERELLGADRDARLAAIMAVFQAHPRVQARIVTRSDDLLGERIEEGELRLDRPGRLLRRFTQPALKLWSYASGQLTEYVERTRTAYIKDFTHAPRALNLLDAAVMLDFKRLEQFFDLHVYESADGTRLVCARKADDTSRVPYQRIQARLAPGGIFFHEIEYLPDSGDRTTEQYLDIQPVAAWKEDAFDLQLPSDAKRQTTAVSDSERK